MFQVQSIGKGLCNVCPQPKEFLKDARFLLMDALSSKPAEVEW